MSIDTTKAGVARAAVAAGATLVNDVSASLEEVAAETGAGFVAMHRLGTPADMQNDPYYDDVVDEVTEYLAARAARALEVGVSQILGRPRDRFRQDGAANLQLLAGLGKIVALGYPVLVGTSRKTFLGHLAAGNLDRDGEPAAGSKPSPFSERFEGSLASATFAMTEGAAAVRVHDVAATAQAARLVGAVSP